MNLFRAQIRVNTVHQVILEENLPIFFSVKSIILSLFILKFCDLSCMKLVVEFYMCIIFYNVTLNCDIAKNDFIYEI